MSMKCYLNIHQTVYDITYPCVYTVGNSKHADIFLAEWECFTIEVTASSVTVGDKTYGEGIHEVVLPNDIHLTISLLLKEYAYLFQQSLLTIGKEAYYDIQTEIAHPISIVSYHTGYLLQTEGEFYVNGHRYEQSAIISSYDRVFLLEGYSFSIEEYIFRMSSIAFVYSELTHLHTVEKDEYKRKKSSFYRSPRIRIHQAEHSIEIKSPPVDDKRDRGMMKSLVPSLVMISAMVLMNGVLGSGNSGMMFVSGISAVVSIGSYVLEKRNRKREKAKKEAQYVHYLHLKNRELYQLSTQERKRALFYFPPMEQLVYIVETADVRLYERTIEDADFLAFSLGTGTSYPSFSLRYSSGDGEGRDTPLQRQYTNLIKRYERISDIPVSLSLKYTCIGFVGQKTGIIEQIHHLIMQLSTFHSYHDVQFILVFKPEELAVWWWSRWIPHVHIAALNYRGFVYHSQSREQLLQFLSHTVKERQRALERKQGLMFSPHYIVIISDRSLMEHYDVMNSLLDNHAKLGISYIFLEDTIEDLPEYVQMIIEYKSDTKGIWYVENGNLADTVFVPHPPVPVNIKEQFARHIASISHVRHARHDLPDMVTFLELYNVSTVEELNILERWKEKETYQTLAVPIGVRGQKDSVYLNLHEKSHGPHGLIAGTTGSGKSELIQTYILSLAVQYPPQELVFLLIDYKGGGMAHQFAHLPHLVGTITNLDASATQRALLSIEAEIHKRQLLFQQCEVNHINQYMKLFKMGKVASPMPHLFIISDEFAELKAEQPDFMKQLITTARVGRSLGIHLILATQKPSGVVDDQIWSNARCKIALKVQDISDSKEMIKKTDAAEITQVGRAYLQVGNNEVYELFQSAWSGAPYEEKSSLSAMKEHTVYLIRENGQLDPINQDLSGLDHCHTVYRPVSQLEAVIREIRKQFHNSGYDLPSKPVLPPLKQQIFSDDIQTVSFEEEWNKPFGKAAILFGVQDLPHKQQQTALYMTVEQAGHVAVISAQGYGKTTFIQSVVIDSMRKLSPHYLHVYVYDFGTRGLAGLDDFPHVADYFIVGEAEKIVKSIRILKQEMSRRKEAFAAKRVTSIFSYNESNDGILPLIYIVIDSFDTLAQEVYFNDMYTFLLDVSREGGSLGIYVLLTASRLSAVSSSLQIQFKTKLSLYVFDPLEVASIIGSGAQLLEDVKGRAVVKLEKPTVMQVVLPYSCLESSAYIKSMTEEAYRMNLFWKKEKPSRIPMLPEHFNVEWIKQNNDWVEDDQNLLIGLYKEDVSPALFSLNETMTFATDSIWRLTMYYRLVDEYIQWHKKLAVTIIDPFHHIPLEYFKCARRVTTQEEIKVYLRCVMEQLTEKKAIEKRSKEIQVLIIPELNRLEQFEYVTAQEFMRLLLEGAKNGILLLFIGEYASLFSGFGQLVQLHKQLATQVFLGMNLKDQSHIPFSSSHRYSESIPLNQGYMVKNATVECVQLVENEVALT